MLSPKLLWNKLFNQWNICCRFEKTSLKKEIKGKPDRKPLNYILIFCCLGPYGSFVFFPK